MPQTAAAKTPDSTAPDAPLAAPAAPSVSVFRKRLRKFRSLKRGYYSFLVLVIAYALSFFLPLLANSKALVVRYHQKTYFPLLHFYAGKTFGQLGETSTYGEGEANYRLLQARFKAEGSGDWVLMPPVPYDPVESAQIHLENEIKDAYARGDFSADEAPPPVDESADEEGYAGDEDDEGYAGDDDEYMGDEDEASTAQSAQEEAAREELIAQSPPFPPSVDHWLGTDDRGRDIVARLAYGFNVSMTFAVVLTLIAYILGIVFGSILGFYGGKVDLFGQRVIEVWQTVPFLFTVMILGAALAGVLSYLPSLPSILQPRFLLLLAIMAVFSWMGMTYYVRGEFLREKARDYVSAAVANGVRDRTIMFRHILPNARTPVVTFAPFTIVGNISALVALDYLGFGLPAPTPSWGELMKQALPEHIGAWWLAGTPIAALFITLLLVVFIGEAVREAFDPKVFSRLR